MVYALPDFAIKPAISAAQALQIKMALTREGLCRITRVPRKTIWDITLGIKPMK